MPGTSLSLIFDRILARTTPLVAMSAVIQGASCCPPTKVNEVRAIHAMPQGWTYTPGQSHFGTPRGEITTSPDAEEITHEECVQLCGDYVDSCELVAECEPLPPPVAFDGDNAAKSKPVVQGKDPNRCDVEHSGKPDALRVVCHLSIYQACGRKPCGMRLGRRMHATLRDLLESAARLEIGSVDAFAILGAELSYHGAPPRLVAGAYVAMRDEIRHARAMNALLRRRGGPRAPRRGGHASPATRPRAMRSLAAIAIENAREGCVRETYGALLATWQARHAEDPEVRAAYARIAPDETRHAELARRVDAWARSRLDRASLARVERARRAAIADVRRSLEMDPPAAFARAAGLPSAQVAHVLLRELVVHLGTHPSRPG